MKTLEQILKSRKVFVQDWLGTSQDDIFGYFDNAWDEEQKKLSIAAHKGEKILFASYAIDGYDGSAFVLFSKEGKLYEVNASHCSCMGLEGQWEPEEVNLKELKNRMEVGDLGVGYPGDFSKELKKFLGIRNKE